MGRVDFLNCFVWNLKTVSPLKLMFSEGPSVFVRFVCNHGALKFHLHMVALPGHWPCHDQASLEKVEQVRTWLLSSILAEFQQLYSEWFFQFCFIFFPLACMGSSSVFAVGVLWFFWFVVHGRNGVFDFFFWNFQTVSSLKLIFSEGPSLFVRFVCNDGALKLRLHVVALPASMAMSWRAEIT